MNLRKNIQRYKFNKRKFTIICLANFLLFSLLIIFGETVFVIDKNIINGAVSVKYFWFYLIIGLCSLATFGLIVALRNKLQFCLLDGLMLLLGITILLFNIYLHNSEAIAGQVILILVLILYFYFRVILQTDRRAFYWFSVCLILTGLVEGVWGLRQLYGYAYSQHTLFKLTGSFFNPGPFGCYLAVVLPMGVWYGFFQHGVSRSLFTEGHGVLHLLQCNMIKLFSVATVIAIMLVLPATMSRAAWMGAIGGGGLVLFYAFWDNQRYRDYVVLNKKRMMLLAAIVTFLIIVGGFGAYKFKKDSADGRALIWKNTVELIRQNPMGVGLGNFSGSYGHIQAAYFASGKGTEQEQYVAGNPEYAFNEYLQICAEHGIVVFLLFIGIAGYSLYIGIKRRHIGATGSLLALLIVAGASYPFSLLPFLIVLAFLLALIHRNEKGIAIPRPVSVAFAFGCLIVVTLCLYNRYPTYNAYKQWNKIQYMYNFGQYQETVNAYDKLYPCLSDQIQFLFEYGRSLSQIEQYEESNKVLERAIKISCDPMLYNIMGKNYQGMKRYAEAEGCFVKASNIVPNRIYPYYLMMKLHIETGDMAKARSAAQIVLTKEPKVQSTAVGEMREEAKIIVNG